MSRVSVIIPVYNVEKYLRECLDSVVNQTFSDIEIICVDDGSDDNSLKILEEYRNKDSRFKIIKGSHQGAGTARNLGIKSAKSDYILFLDSDDYFEPVLIEELYIRAEKHNADLVVCSYRKVDNEGNITESRNPNSPVRLDKTPLEKSFNRHDFKEDFFELLTPVPWNKLYRKSLLENNGIEFPPLRICEDVAFVYESMACADRITVCDKELINYRYNRPQSMADYRTKYAIDIVHSCLALKKFLQNAGLYDELRTTFIKAFKNHIRWEIAQCSDSEYNSFLTEFKSLMPDEWVLYESALRKDYITLDYIKDFIGDKKIMFWGASFFLQKLLAKEKNKNSNIIGIVDKNVSSWGKTCGNYKIFPPESLKTIKPDGVVMSVWSNYESVYPELKKEFSEKYPDIELMPNIFEKEIH